MDRRNFLKPALTTGALTGLGSAHAQLGSKVATTTSINSTVNPRCSIVESHLPCLEFLQSTDGLTKLTEALY